MKKTKKKILSLLLTAVMVISLLPLGGITALAVSEPDSYKFDLVDGSIAIFAGTDSGVKVTCGSYSKDDIAFTQNIEIFCSSTSTSNTITVSAGITDPVNITLSGVNIDVSGTESACAFSIGDNSTVNLTLTGENTLKSADFCAGLSVPLGAGLIVTADSTGSLTATGGDNNSLSGAGIGGNGSSSPSTAAVDVGTITINGGTIKATGGTLSAGIGGGRVSTTGGTGGTVTITGGTVTATGGNCPGIGGGISYNSYQGGNGSLYISGGSVNTTYPSPSVHPSSGSTTPLFMTYVYNLPKNSAVTCSINGGKNFSCQTDSSGYLYLWMPSDNVTVQVNYGNRYFKYSGHILPTDFSACANECLIISGGSLPDCVIGSACSQALTVSGGTPATYSWKISSGKLPDGLSLTSGTSSSSSTGTISGTLKETGNFSFTVQVTDSNGITASLPLSLKVYQTFSIDLTALSVDGATLDPTFGRDIVAYSVTKTSGSFTDSITVTATMADSNSTLTIGGNSVTCTAGTGTATVSLKNGANLIPVTVTSKDGLSQKSYILSVNGTVSNAELGSLSIGGGVQTVGASNFTYNVGSDIASIDITAAASDSKAVMLLNGAILSQGGTKSVNLSVGENKIELMVIAQNASTKTYTITVNRGTSDATLSNLTLSAGTLSTPFDSSTYSYAATVSNSTASLTVAPTPNDGGASVTVNGNPASTAVTLSVGDNVITVKVTGKDSVTTKTYTITVTRQAAITISTASLPIGIVGASYSKTLSATGGSGSYAWSWEAAGSTLPSAFTLSTAGVLSVTSGGKLTDTDIGSYKVNITVADASDSTVKQAQEFTLTIRKGCGNGAYLIESDADTAYTGSYTDDGIPTLTVNTGYTGFRYFSVNITKVTGHSENEVCVFVQTRGGQQIGINATKGDFDTLSSATAAFNVKAGDIIKVYIVDKLSNDASSNPNVL